MVTNEYQQQQINKWNSRHLQSPPITTYKASKAVDITGLYKSFETAVEFFENQTHLDKELTLLSRMIYRMKNKFRTDKGFNFMQKLNRSLRKYSEQNLLVDINNFLELLPKMVKPGTYLPSGNLLDYVIVKLQGSTALMCYVVETAKIAAHLMEERIAIGQFWKMAFFAYALLSRIWFLCNDVINFCCKWYQEILPMRNLLEKGSNSWVGDDYVFPMNLAMWLNIQQLRDDPSSTDLPAVFTEEVQDEADIESIKETSVDYPQIGEFSQAKQKSAFELLLEDEEMGEVVKIDKEAPIKKTKRKKLKHKNKMMEEDGTEASPLQLIENINSFKLLNIFLEKESNLRKENRKRCIYKNIDGLQWNMLQNKMKKFSKKAVGNENKKSVHLNKAITMLKSLL